MKIMIRPKPLLVLVAISIGLVTLYIYGVREDENIFKNGLNTDINTKEYIPSAESQQRVIDLSLGAGKNTEGVKVSKNGSQDDVVAIAKEVAKYNRTVLVTMVNDAYLSFTYSWLCNTKDMGIHKSVLIITTDDASKTKLTRDWPEISVVAMDVPNTKGDQVYSHVGYVKIMVKRTEMLLSILMADIEIFVFEVDCLWFANPTPVMQNIKDADILVNPVAKTDNKVVAGGFLYLFATDKAKALWKQVTSMMVDLGTRMANMKNEQTVSEADNDQQYLSRLVNQKYGGISIKILTLEDYADGQWYLKSEEDRSKVHPYVVNNNWVLGNEKKITRAKEWKHWFIRDDWSCDMELVRKTVYH